MDFEADSHVIPNLITKISCSIIMVPLQMENMRFRGSTVRLINVEATFDQILIFSLKQSVGVIEQPLV